MSNIALSILFAQMAWAGKSRCKNEGRKIIQCSDESDEDYVVGEDEDLNDSEEYCCSSDGNESLESTGEFEEDEGKEIKKVVRSKKVGKHGSYSWTNKLKPLLKRRRQSRNEDSSSDSDSDSDYNVDDDEFKETNDSDDSFDGNESEDSLGEFDEDEKMKKVRSKEGNRRLVKKTNRVKSRPKKRRLFDKENETSDSDSDFCNHDDDFMPDEINGLDYDDDEFLVKRKRTQRHRSQKNAITKGWKKKKKRTCKRPKDILKNNPNRNVRLIRKAGYTDAGGSRDEIWGLKEKSWNISKRRGKRFSAGSSAVTDLNFISAGSSDLDCIISEDEGKLVRETNSLRNSALSERLVANEEKSSHHQKHGRRKEVERVEDLKLEAGKQVCGICFTEQGKKTVRGTLNCCSHYFCFACIMEWSKVESRCPLCKQRFVAVSKPARSNTGLGLRDVVIQVPERDQIYQPSEEELRSYIDPYENVTCSECQQGGDDHLMLLCDLCDSPAHTYCVGLGVEVPEGSWYCEGCRPTVLDFPNQQYLLHTPDQTRESNLSCRSSPAVNSMEDIDLNVAYVPETPLTPENVTSRSPSIPSFGNIRTANTSGPVAFTVFQRRRIQNQIQHVLNFRLREQPAASLGNNNGSHLVHGEESISQPSNGERLEIGTTTLSLRNRNNHITRSSLSRDPIITNQTSTVVNT